MALKKNKLFTYSTTTNSKPNKILIDIQEAAILQLLKEDIKQNKININRVCAYSNPKLLNFTEEIRAT